MTTWRNLDNYFNTHKYTIDMKDPKVICRDHNLNSYQARKGAEAMADAIRQDIEAILTTPSDKTVAAQIKEYFRL